MEPVVAQASDDGAIRESIADGLLHPALYSAGVDHVELVETHISWVFLAGDRAYKVKKPVEMPFLDYRELETRRRFCHEEVRLNRRLAPDLYIGVRAIVVGRDGRFALAPAGAARAVEYAVEMQRFDRGRTLAELLRRGEPSGDALAATARRVAAFHGAARVVHGRDTDEFRLELDNTLATLLELGPSAQRRLLERLERALRGLTERSADELSARAAAGLVRDGHGDLRAEHVVLGDRPTIFDCVEFDPRLREIDIGCDFAFLAMDVERLAGREPAARLASAYCAAGGDPGSEALAALFAAYRACVLAKVAALRARQLAGTAAEAQRAQSQALVRLAWRFVWRTHVPLVLAVCGPPASGKTVLARELASVSGLQYLSSDLTRKGLAGLAPTARADPELYRPDVSERVYESLGQRAEESIAGGGAVVDATFGRREWREAFCRQLRAHEPVFVECLAPPEVILDRARKRLHDPARESDAGPTIVQRQLALWEPPIETPIGLHLVVRTDQPVELAAADVEAALACGAARVHRGRTASTATS